MNVHFIAIGGAAMHNLAIALHLKGYTVTGSDDEIYEPSKSRLASHGILPDKIGWFPEKLTKNIDFVILGMHARVNNPELIKAQELGLTIYSYPQFLVEQTLHKRRIVIGGSHGKTTVTSMIMHVLKYYNKKFNYLVGSLVEGFDCMVDLNDEATIALFEGDEYLASPLHPVPKFHFYQPHIAVITGIAWDHVNVFPTFEEYVLQFKKFIETVQPNGKIFVDDTDIEIKKLLENKNYNQLLIPYNGLAHVIENNITYIVHNNVKYKIPFFGEHNMRNAHVAKLVCNELGINTIQFISAIQHFTGASKRLEKIIETNLFTYFRDFAHSPSKLKATVDAVKENYSTKKLIACMELHTFSSLTSTFLTEYKDTMNSATIAIVYFNEETIKHKKLPPITTKNVIEAFNNTKLLVFTNQADLKKHIEKINLKNSVLLMMSSGTFDGLNFIDHAKELIKLQQL